MQWNYTKTAISKRNLTQLTEITAKLVEHRVEKTDAIESMYNSKLKIYYIDDNKAMSLALSAWTEKLLFKRVPQLGKALLLYDSVKKIGALLADSSTACPLHA